MASYAEYVQEITEKAIRLGQAAGSCACPGMKNIGKPCTGKPYARFDEGGLVMVSMGWLLRHRRTKAAETDRPTPNAAGASSLLYPVMCIVDRKKELMVLSNGENVPPARVEKRLAIDACVLQAMVVGDQRPSLTALVVPDAAQLGAVWSRERKRQLPEDWRENADVHQWLLERMHRQCHELPSFMLVKEFVFVDEEWTQAEGMLTPTLKFKRRKIMARHQDEIDAMYGEEAGTSEESI